MAEGKVSIPVETPREHEKAGEAVAELGLVA